MKTTTKKNISTGEAQPSEKVDIDARELMLTMAKALCRQHIMWPAEGPLPCETGVNCDKQHMCTQMAEDVINFTKSLEAEKEN